MIEQDQVVVENVMVDGIEIRLQNLIIHLVETSLFESHVHYATKNFEKVFDRIIHGLNRLSRLFVTLLTNWDRKFLTELLSGRTLGLWWDHLQL